MQSELLKSQFATIAKQKSANFRTNCLDRADLNGIDRANVPMPLDFYKWLMTYESRLEKQGRTFYLRCEYTGELVKVTGAVDEKSLQIDHRTPISRGGSFGIENLAITTAQNNQRKGSLNESEFKRLLDFLTWFEPVAKTDVLTRLRRGAVNRKF